MKPKTFNHHMTILKPGTFKKLRCLSHETFYFQMNQLLVNQDLAVKFFLVLFCLFSTLASVHVEKHVIQVCRSLYQLGRRLLSFQIRKVVPTAQFKINLMPI